MGSSRLDEQARAYALPHLRSGSGAQGQKLRVRVILRFHSSNDLAAPWLCRKARRSAFACTHSRSARACSADLWPVTSGMRGTCGEVDKRKTRAAGLDAISGLLYLTENGFETLLVLQLKEHRQVGSHPEPCQAIIRPHSSCASPALVALLAAFPLAFAVALAVSTPQPLPHELQCHRKSPRSR